MIGHQMHRIAAADQNRRQCLGGKQMSARTAGRHQHDLGPDLELVDLGA